MSTRSQTLKKIGNLLDNKCGNCPKKEELNKLHGSAFARIDSFCNRECKVGSQLQELGKRLVVGQRQYIDEVDEAV
ncbi:zinc-finger domain-containing protein [Paenibacillus sp. L3-i20]|uniref:zinc-finger domain-containing protein n=1 Tax=Paenibacillus sp. L3-i20 TaxID=2905833 RepID=UPI001EE137E2|nr:zinc-finger domain-containing protein [Paenibacillus sp. L3-i20]GKU76870.1 hypothetical protein L3i20_v212670 [Paenibacillus sp. L3-i20]